MGGAGAGSGGHHGPVERAGDGDEAALIELAVASGATDWSPASLRDELRRGDGRCWLVRAAGSLAGLLIAREVLDELHVMGVGVAVSARRRGVGRALVAAALEHARARRMSRVLLELRASNRPARALYEASGFVVVGRRPRYYPGGEDAVLMTADLGCGPRDGSRADEQVGSGASGERGRGEPVGRARRSGRRAD